MTLQIAVVGTGKVAQNYLAAITKREDVTLTYYNRTRTKAEATARNLVDGWQIHWLR
ncbi:MAG: hypothetical protein R2932_48280 [Caldilineaceae bacterium]